MTVNKLDKKTEENATRQTEWPSVNATVEPLVKALVAEAQELRVEVTRGTLGECRIDCGVRAVGGLVSPRSVSAGLAACRSRPPITKAPGRSW